MKPRFERCEGRDGVRIVDPIESRRLDVYTPEPVAPAPADETRLAFPVDAAVEFSASEVRVPALTEVFVRDPDGTHITDAVNGESVCVAHGESVLEVGGTPIKLYLGVESAVSVSSEKADVTVSFDGETDVLVGARSFHERPTGTITVDGSVRDAMRAASHLGSALKTTSPERSYPTLRGHPPLVEVGDEFSVPDGVERPDTGVTLELPADWESVYPAVPLAYYLGADVVPGAQPRLATDRGFVHVLDAPDGFAAEVGRVLRQTFLLDCVTRTEGLYKVPLHERAEIEPHVDLDFVALYDRPLADRVAAYLDVPYGVVADRFSEWPLTTDVVPSASNVEMLPFLADDLALVRCPSTSASAQPAESPAELADFYRSGGQRSATAADASAGTEVVNPGPVETLDHAWVGDGFPLGGTKATLDAYRRRARRSPKDRDEIRIAVVCNDDEMRDEGVVESLYGDRDRLDFDVRLACDLGTDDLAAAFDSDADFLHFVGHVDDRGLQCVDGFLDAGALDDVNVDAFLLNACSSYEQGAVLVERGAMGGVVTLRPVGNEGATRVGRTLARLLNRGFSLSAALSLARDETMLGNQYVVVGDGDTSLVQTASPCPLVLGVKPVGDRFVVEVRSFPLDNLGGVITPNVGENSMRYVNVGTVGSFEVTESELNRYLACEPMPVRTDDGIVFSTDVSADSFRR
jgi:hypothetical protein